MTKGIKNEQNVCFPISLLSLRHMKDEQNLIFFGKKKADKNRSLTGQQVARFTFQ
jgi:hypothetical protein